jgi:hypothetical protein
METCRPRPLLPGCQRPVALINSEPLTSCRWRGDGADAWHLQRFCKWHTCQRDMRVNAIRRIRSQTGCEVRPCALRLPPGSPHQESSAVEPRLYPEALEDIGLGAKKGTNGIRHEGCVHYAVQMVALLRPRIGEEGECYRGWVCKTCRLEDNVIVVTTRLLTPLIQLGQGCQDVLAQRAANAAICDRNKILLRLQLVFDCTSTPVSSQAQLSRRIEAAFTMRVMETRARRCANCSSKYFSKSTSREAGERLARGGRQQPRIRAAPREDNKRRKNRKSHHRHGIDSHTPHHAGAVLRSTNRSARAPDSRIQRHGERGSLRNTLKAHTTVLEHSSKWKCCNYCVVAHLAFGSLAFTGEGRTTHPVAHPDGPLQTRSQLQRSVCRHQTSLELC